VPARTVGRIQTRAAFAQVQRSRARASSGPVRVTFVAVDAAVPGVYPQVGYAISKKCGNAVTRNALRRRMREVARAAGPGLPRGIYVVRLDPAAATSGRARFRTDVGRALERAAQTARVTT
jgi:ribonuclease P protein component